MSIPQGPAGAVAPEYPSMAPVPAKPKRRARKILLRVLVLLVVLVVGVAVLAYFGKNDPSVAKAGNCVHNSGSDSNPDVKIVSCTAADADFKVLKVVRNTKDSACDGVVGLTASYLEDDGSGDSFTLCLGKNG